MNPSANLPADEHKDYGSTTPDDQSMRVCDRCIKKKVKCDRQRPTCSRCREVNLDCTYGSLKHKPGPARGSRRIARSSKVEKRTKEHSGDGSATTLSRVSPSSMADGADSATDSTWTKSDLTRGQDQDHSRVYSASTGSEPAALPQLDSIEARNILQRFFDDILPAIPLFGRAKFFSLYDANLLSYDLILTIVAITAKILNISNISHLPQPESTLDLLLKMSSAEHETSNESQSLDMFRKEVLLAYYDFHHSPGQRSWMRVSRATRKAYVLGLHQLENPNHCLILKSSLFTPEEVEEWRSLWWCLYCLDSYVNLSADTPFSIELESLNTALPHCSLDQMTTTNVPEGPKILLPSEIDELWKTAQEVVAVSALVDFNIHIVTTTMARQTGTVLRVQLARPSAAIDRKREALDKSFAAIRFVLPPHYLNSRRNSLQSETHGVHHLRLTSVLLLHMNRIFISLPPKLHDNRVEWHRRWQQVIEASEDIVSVVGQWDTRYCSRIDPAICLIVFIALGFLSLQRRNPDSSEALRTDLQRGEVVLKLFLENFANMWSLPKYLLSEHAQREKSWPDTINFEDIDHYMTNFKAPLHPKVIKAFSPALPLWGVDTNNNNLNSIFDPWDFDAFVAG